MKASSQLLIAVRLLCTVEDFCARFNIFLEAGKIHLYCRNDQIVFVELGDLFPASWLSRMTMHEVAAALRAATSSEEKVQIFSPLMEKPELKTVFTEAVKKHLSDFFVSEVRKCELRPDRFSAAPQIFSLAEMLTDCAGRLLTSVPLDDFIPNNLVPFQQAPDYLEKSARVKISLQEGYLISRLERSLTLSDILSMVPGEEELTRRSLLKLWAFGIVDSPFLNQVVPQMKSSDLKPGVSITGASDRAKEKAFHEQIEMIEQTYQGLSRKDFYSLLDVGSRAEVPEIKSAYYRLARQFHPDRFYGLDDPVVKEKVDVIFSTINIAYETLKNSKTRQQYDTAPVEERRIITTTIAPDTVHVKKDAAGRVAEDYFQRAQKSYAARNYFEAVQFLRSATQIAPEVAKYWTQLGIALSKNEQWRKEAEDSFHRAIEIDPTNVENHLYLAFLYKNSGLKLRARKSFMSALEVDPDNDVANVELGELEEEEKQQSQKKSIISGIFKKK